MRLVEVAEKPRAEWRRKSGPNGMPGYEIYTVHPKYENRLVKSLGFISEHEKPKQNKGVVELYYIDHTVKVNLDNYDFS